MKQKLSRFRGYSGSDLLGMLRAPLSKTRALNSGLTITQRSTTTTSINVDPVAEMAEAQPIFPSAEQELTAIPGLVTGSNEKYVNVTYDRQDQILPPDTLLLLNHNAEDAIPFLKFKRFTTDSPEEVLVGFDMNTSHIHQYLKDLDSKLMDFCIEQGRNFMPDRDNKWESKPMEVKREVLQEKWRGLLIPPKEDGQQMELAKFKVHPKANFYSHENEPMTKNEFKAHYVDSDEANAYSYKMIIEVRSVRYTKQKNLKVQAILHGVKAVYTPSRQKEVEYEDELPEQRVVFPDDDEPSAKAQRTG